MSRPAKTANRTWGFPYFPDFATTCPLDCPLTCMHSRVREDPGVSAEQVNRLGFHRTREQAARSVTHAPHHYCCCYYHQRVERSQSPLCLLSPFQNAYSLLLVMAQGEEEKAFPLFVSLSSVRGSSSGILGLESAMRGWDLAAVWRGGSRQGGRVKGAVRGWRLGWDAGIEGVG